MLQCVSPSFTHGSWFNPNAEVLCSTFTNEIYFSDLKWSEAGHFHDGAYACSSTTYIEVLGYLLQYGKKIWNIHYSENSTYKLLKATSYHYLGLTESRSRMISFGPVVLPTFWSRVKSANRIVYRHCSCLWRLVIVNSINVTVRNEVRREGSLSNFSAACDVGWWNSS